MENRRHYCQRQAHFSVEEKKRQSPVGTVAFSLILPIIRYIDAYLHRTSKKENCIMRPPISKRSPAVIEVDGWWMVSTVQMRWRSMSGSEGTFT